MRAMVWTRYGPPEVLQPQEVATPKPRAGEVLVRIRATTVSAGDCELRGLRVSLGLRILFRTMFGFTRPRRRILGQEFAGDVAATGPGVTLFRVGDPVFGTTGFGFGAYAEYVRVPERSRGAALAMRPANMDFEEAAAVPTGALEALHFLRRAGPLQGRSVLINGAGGGIGLFAVQLAKYFGADVTAVDSTGKLDLLRSVGADHVLDYTREDFTKRGDTYDVVYDSVGKGSVPETFAVIRNGGRYLVGNATVSTKLRAYPRSKGGGKQLLFGAASQTSEELDFLRQLIEAGQLRAVIDRRFRLEELPEAHRYFESGRTRGRVVITV
ncbi:MAG: NAD(P)-dependent alcohol dehydrogenase [Thermoplasmata archaeon]|nr:NAD(P)-dependent alcohol dehydrogenase [Thermoplasmata archaeon]